MKYLALVALIASASAVKIQREPLLTWAPTEPATFKMNYPVPDFGPDPDIVNSLKHSEALTEPAKKIVDFEEVFPYQDEKFHVDKKFKLTPTMQYPKTEEFD